MVRFDAMIDGDWAMITGDHCRWGGGAISRG